jgi:DNA-binding transcriptional ArsR family regulator
MSRPLHHPAADDVTVEGILHALSDPVRVEILARLAGVDCAQTCTSVIGDCAKDVPKSTVSQHFKVLREAGLIHSERKGVELRNTSRIPEIERRFPGLLPAILAAHKAQRARSQSRRKSRP